MTRARCSIAATLVALAIGAGLSAAQGTQAPPMKSVLAGKKLTPPARGEVIVEYTNPVRKRVGDSIVTTFQVKNVGLAPIARLTIIQTWFDKANNAVGGGKGVENMLQPGEVKTITISSEAKPIYNGDGFNFTHANGTVKTKLVAKLTATAAATSAAPTAKPAAAKPAAAKPAAGAKK